MGETEVGEVVLRKCVGDGLQPCRRGKSGGPLILALGTKGDRCRGCRATMIFRTRREANGTEEDRQRELKELTKPWEWSELAESKDIKGDLLWAYANTQHIQRRGAKLPVIYWGRCSMPPSRSADFWLEAAATNPANFAEKIYRLVEKSEEEGDEPGLVREERHGIAEVERIIGEMSK